MKKRTPFVATIGVFDGVHRGHQALVKETVRLARRLKSQPWVFTFQDHPIHVLRGGPRVPFLLERRETFRLLQKEGLSRVRVIPFNRAFSKKSPVEFIQWLRSQGSLKGIVVGKDFRFGKDAQGNVSILEMFGRQEGFEVRAVVPVRVKGKTVSSSMIRQLLSEGQTQKAHEMLGRPYTIEGWVVHGKHLGHKIGFPTANLGNVKEFLPKDGVYACAVEIGKKFYRAGMNLGSRPTFQDDDHHRQAEVHLLHYYGRLYGRRLRVLLLDYLRPERKFKNSKQLVAQIRKDLARIQKIKWTGLRTS